MTSGAVSRKPSILRGTGKLLGLSSSLGSLQLDKTPLRVGPHSAIIVLVTNCFSSGRDEALMGECA
jgi:hypothetical protein